MADTYPKREPFFSQKVIRLLVKTCAAQEMGQSATLLVVIVAATEDAARYRRPVTFYNSQLLPLLGIRKWDALNDARQAAISAGWLHYEAPPRGRRTPGKYWVTIPTEAHGLADSPVDERDELYPLNGDSRSKASPANGDTSGDTPGDTSGELSTLSLYPTPNPKKRARSSDYSADFARWWETYPRKIGKAAAARAYSKAIASLKGEHNGMADNWLLEQTAEFARSDAGQAGRFTPHPATWLNQERFRDDPQEWSRKHDKAKYTAGPGQVHPDTPRRF